MAFGTNTRELDKLQPPQSLDAEQAVLGSILKDEEAMAVAIGVLEIPEHFYFPKHQAIFRACLALYEKSEPCDITTVANHLQGAGQLEKISGRTYLVELVEAVASTSNVEHYARIVLDKSLGRRLIDTSNEISRAAYGDEMPMQDLLDSAEANIFSIASGRMQQGFASMRQLMPESLNQIESIQTGGNWVDSIPSGFDDLDYITQGFKKGDLIIVAGRPSMGKSGLAMNIAEAVVDCQEKRAVAVFSVEMSKEQLALRMVCSRARVSTTQLRRGKLTADDFDKISRSAGHLAQSEIFIDDSPTLSPLQIRAKARRLKAQYPHLSLVVVDYIQMMHATGRIENRQQEMSVISRSLKQLAKELQLPVIACSQLSRQVEQRGGDKRPQLSDLRESGAIEQDADVVMFVYRPEYYLTDDEKNDPKNFSKIGVAEIIVAKQRNGPTGTARLTFLKDYACFVNSTRTELSQQLPPEEKQGMMPF